MKQTILAILFMVMVISSGYGGVITGRTINAEDKSPLVGANVTIEGTTLGASSDQQGNFRIDNVPAGAYTVKTTFIGFHAATRKITVEKDGVAMIQFKLAASVFNMGDHHPAAIGNHRRSDCSGCPHRNASAGFCAEPAWREHQHERTRSEICAVPG